MKRTLPLIETEEEIRAAIGLLDPVVRDAARHLCLRILNHREIADDARKLRMVFGEQCLFAMSRHGWKMSDAERFKAFLDGYAELVMSLTLSILRLIGERSRQRRWGWLRGAQPKFEEDMLSDLFDRPSGSREAAG